jgi:hypothetical protein
VRNFRSRQQICCKLIVYYQSNCKSLMSVDNTLWNPYKDGFFWSYPGFEHGPSVLAIITAALIDWSSTSNCTRCVMCSMLKTHSRCCHSWVLKIHCFLKSNSFVSNSHTFENYIHRVCVMHTLQIKIILCVSKLYSWVLNSHFVLKSHCCPSKSRSWVFEWLSCIWKRVKITLISFKILSK